MSLRQCHQPSSLYPLTFRDCRFPYELKDLEGSSLHMAMLDIFLATPARDMEVLKSLHSILFEKDPVFYGQIARWFIQEGQNEEHKSIFLANLFTSPHCAHRRIAAQLTDLFSARELSRVLDYCKRVQGFFPRSARSAVECYLRSRERDASLFDMLVIKNRRHIKHLYASLRIRPSARAQKILFENDPPEESLLFALKQLIRERDPEVQLRLVVDFRIPFSLALTLIRNITSALVIPMIQLMMPRDLIEVIHLLRNRGVLKGEEVQRLVAEKLRAVPPEKKIAPSRQRVVSRTPCEFGHCADRVVEIVRECSDAGIWIERPTALLIDKSGSMETVLDLGKVVAAVISPLAKERLYTYLFDSGAHPLAAEGTDPAAWEKCFGSYSTGGSTCIGAVMDMMRERNERVEQIVVMTDGNENLTPSFAEAFHAYQAAMHMTPLIIIVKVGHFSKRFEKMLTGTGMCAIMQIGSSDRLSLLHLVILLSGPGQNELMKKISSSSPECGEVPL